MLCSGIEPVRETRGHFHSEQVKGERARRPGELRWPRVLRFGSARPTSLHSSGDVHLLNLSPLSWARSAHAAIALLFVVLTTLHLLLATVFGYLALAGPGCV